jgi:alpha-glucosidase
MPWSSTAPNLGFSSGEPWLPLGDAHRALAVDLQQSVQDSVLKFTRQCLELRRAHPALHHGSMRVVEAGEQKLSFERGHDTERLLCTFNLSDRPCGFRSSGTPLIAVGDVGADALGGYAAVIEEIA